MHLVPPSDYNVAKLSCVGTLMDRRIIVSIFVMYTQELN